jgi:hypothetical protein
MTRLSNGLHRRGIARVLNTGSNNMNSRCTAYIETRGPRWVGESLARYALRKSPLCRVDLLTVRTSRVQQAARFKWRWSFQFRRLS